MVKKCKCDVCQSFKGELGSGCYMACKMYAKIICEKCVEQYFKSIRARVAMRAGAEELTKDNIKLDEIDLIIPIKGQAFKFDTMFFYDSKKIGKLSKDEKLIVDKIIEEFK